MDEIGVSRAVFNSFLSISGMYFEGGRFLSQETCESMPGWLANPKKLVEFIFERMLY